MTHQFSVLEQNMGTFDDSMMKKMKSVRTPFMSGIFRVKSEAVLWHPTCYCWLEKRQAEVDEGPDPKCLEHTQEPKV